MTIEEQEDEFRQCAGCHTGRLCRFYRSAWFCINGPAKCWRYRKVRWAELTKNA